ncbi:heparinase II/III family protein [Pontivivens insulae]|uniref:Heparinase II/III-like C-terminal domain-containing protein n=1 Tax=Pontivivens insulae TaxID=1639689 RepID=A0A2R8A808_9RHOB|nr:heparinase II/III family protein [Pontivivens insulae]RED18465.1 putative heparinase superfamily protein [Pontivivens insulae]SPF28363.1 hypothetical protein POI8812_00661 [Pontivivens insulae]
MARPTLRNRLSAADNRVQALRSAFASKVKAIRSQPEPRRIGDAALARQMKAGLFQLGGEMIEAGPRGIWNLPEPSEAAKLEAQGFVWLDDLAAAGDDASRALAQDWVWEWIERFGAAKGPGWYPDITGRRLIRWIVHAPFLLKGQEATASHLFFKSLGRQTGYLNHAWDDAADGLPRFEALTGLIYAAISLEGAESALKSARRGLAKACGVIGPDGTIPSRSPEELLEIFTLLVWVADAQRAAGHAPEGTHLDAITRCAPALRALRMGDGALARFHGGGRGAEGALDQALLDSRERAGQRPATAMGYSRISAGRTVVILDGGPMPSDPFRAHAGTLAFEMSSGRRQMIVNQGPGDRFGEDWRKAARETAAHTTLEVANRAMADFGDVQRFGSAEATPMINGPTTVAVEQTRDPSGHWVLGTHDGYSNRSGLIHSRRLFLSPAGDELRGEDTLSAQSSRERARFAKERQAAPIPFAIRFHLHPEVEATLDLGGEAVSLTLKSGEVWVFRQSGGEIGLSNSTYLDSRRVNPRLSQQIVVTGAAMDYSTRVNWVLRRIDGGSTAIRDVVPDLSDD